MQGNEWKDLWLLAQWKCPMASAAFARTTGSGSWSSITKPEKEHRQLRLLYKPKESDWRRQAFTTCSCNNIIWNVGFKCLLMAINGGGVQPLWLNDAYVCCAKLEQNISILKCLKVWWTSPLVMVPMLRWERCSSGRFPRRNPDNAETKTKLMVTQFSPSSCVSFFLGIVKRQKQSRVIIFPCKRSNSTYKHGSSRSDFRPVALEKLDDWDVIKVQHARKVLNLRMRKAPNSGNQLDNIIHCDSQ